MTFYWHKSSRYHCDCCLQVMPRLLIGTHEPGFPMPIKTHPELGIHSIEDWERLLTEGKIFDNDGDEYSAEYVLSLGLKRGSRRE